MRYFDLRGLLPQPDRPATEALAAFERIPPAGAEASVEAATGTAVGAAPERLGEIVDQLAKVGVTADRRTCPDLLGQLRAAGAGRVDAVVCTLLDGDATLRLNAALGSRYPEEVVAGLAFVEALVAPRHSWLVIDVTAPSNWVAPIRGATKVARRRVVSLRNDYPESDPSMLLFTLLRRRLKPGRLPTDVRAVLIDAAAAIALGRFAQSGAGPARTWAAVHHPEWPATRYVELGMGTRLADVLRHMGLRPEDHVIRAGDLLRDQKVTPDVVIGTGELTFHVSYAEREVIPDPCVRCGWCVEGCPVRIHPAGLLEAAQRDDVALGRRYGLDSCIECGVCSYVCPSRLPLLPGIRRLRGGVSR